MNRCAAQRCSIPPELPSLPSHAKWPRTTSSLLCVKHSDGPTSLSKNSRSYKFDGCLGPKSCGSGKNHHPLAGIKSAHQRDNGIIFRERSVRPAAKKIFFFLCLRAQVDHGQVAFAWTRIKASVDAPPGTERIWGRF